MNKLEKIKSKYSCSEIWNRIYNWVQESNCEITGYGNGFDKKGKDYLDDLINYYPNYYKDILRLFE